MKTEEAIGRIEAMQAEIAKLTDEIAYHHIDVEDRDYVKDLALETHARLEGIRRSMLAYAFDAADLQFITRSTLSKLPTAGSASPARMGVAHL